MMSLTPSEDDSAGSPADTAATAPRRMTPQSLRVRDWVWLGSRAYRVSDLRARAVSGHVPVSFGARQGLFVYRAPGRERP